MSPTGAKEAELCRDDSKSSSVLCGAPEPGGQMEPSGVSLLVINTQIWGVHLSLAFLQAGIWDSLLLAIPHRADLPTL